jgi:8-oxo-dGTP pyrophosphatase MutT (NUDIX family)
LADVRLKDSPRLPLGGGIEFGETSAEAIVRKIREELRAKITNLRRIGTLENIFTYLGRPGQEIIQIYDGEFVDHGLYKRPYLLGAESDGTAFKVFWCDKSYFSASLPLYPGGLAELLQTRALFNHAA